MIEGIWAGTYESYRNGFMAGDIPEEINFGPLNWWEKGNRFFGIGRVETKSWEAAARSRHPYDFRHYSYER